MPDWLSQLLSLLNHPSMRDTILLIVTVILVQSIIVMALRRKRETLDEARRRWISFIQNGSLILILLGLLLIWSPQLSTVALSFAAFAVATVIALKEMILSAVGAVFRTSTRPFDIGDWVEIGPHRGEVVGEGLLSVRLMELGRGPNAYTFTGRMTVVPNSRLLLEPVVNESYRRRFVHHTFTIHTPEGTAPGPVLDLIRERIDDLLYDHWDLATRYHSMVRHKTQTEIAAPDPIICIGTTDLARVTFTITIFCPAPKAGAFESDITDIVLSHVAAGKAPP